MDHFANLVNLRLPAKIDTLAQGEQLFNISEFSPKQEVILNNLKDQAKKTAAKKGEKGKVSTFKLKSIPPDLIMDED